MRKIIKKILVYFSKNKFLGAIITHVVYYLRLQRGQIKDSLHMKIFRDLIVQNGPFKGMKYPRNPAASHPFPQLLGSYEKEIQTAIEEICSKKYTEIINVGCAIGYYAVGLARRIPTAKVFAYDINEESLRLCKEMAQINNVSEKLITGSFCDSNTLSSIPLTKKALVFSDCEGYEKKLFTKKTVELFSCHDLLIEIHDFVDIEISAYIQKLFRKTHKIKVFQAISDIEKAQQYSYKELEGLDLATRRTLLAELRPPAIKWFYMKPHIF